MKKSIFKDIGDFNRKICGLKYPKRPQSLDAERKEWACTALAEELFEFKNANNIADEADALIDLMYFAGGRLHEMGLSGQELFDEVHKANMAKQRGSLAKRPGSKGHDAIKPVGWRAPDIQGVIRDTHRNVNRKGPNILIIGHARHGKDTVANFLAEHTGWEYKSTSLMAAEHIVMPVFNSDPALPSYRTPEECYNDRTQFLYPSSDSDNPLFTAASHPIGQVPLRKFWFDAIENYTKDDKARLAREVLKTQSIYCGMRSIKEYMGCVAEDLFDFVIYVEDRSKPKEAPELFDIPKACADVCIDNTNISLEDLYLETAAILSHPKFLAKRG